MFRVMLIDDEPPARRSLRRLLADHPDMAVIGEAGSLSDAVALLPEIRPDLIFLDVELGDGKGFSALKPGDEAPDVIVVTAYSRYAVNAFDVAATDFLVKPVDPQRLALALQRVRERRGSIRAPQPALRIQLPGQQLRIPHDRLLSFAAEGDFTRISVAGEKELLVCRLLGQFEAELPKPPFLRLSRSLVVNLEQVQRVETLEGGRGRLFLGVQDEALPLGRAALRRLREAMA